MSKVQMNRIGHFLRAFLYGVIGSGGGAVPPLCIFIHGTNSR